MTVFKFIKMLATGEYDRSLLLMMLKCQGDWMPDHEVEELSDEALLCSIVNEYTNEGCFARLVETARHQI